MPGASTSEISILDCNGQGFWLCLHGERFYLDFKDFPWFARATPQQLQQVQLPAEGHLYRPALDVDLGLAAIRNPAAFPLVAA